MTGMKLHVGNLSFSVTHDILVDAFSKFGKIEEAVVVVSRTSGRSQGFGFVTFADEESAKKAIAEMDGKNLDGRPMKVSKATYRDDSDRKPKKDFSQGGFRPRRDSGRSFTSRRPGQGGDRRDSSGPRQSPRGGFSRGRPSGSGGPRKSFPPRRPGQGSPSRDSNRSRKPSSREGIRRPVKRRFS